eukprot:Sspe_Gene.5421::Locus_1786_Transcript_1_1_Confidence_1.000_Length_445::g.5421::m.5421
MQSMESHISSLLSQQGVGKEACPSKNPDPPASSDDDDEDADWSSDVKLDFEHPPPGSPPGRIMIPGLPGFKDSDGNVIEGKPIGPPPPTPTPLRKKAAGEPVVPLGSALVLE